MKIKYSFCVVMLCITAKCFAQSNPNHTAYTVNDGKLWASLWQQRAAEYNALCFQAYNLAALRIDEALRHKTKGSKPLAVVTDIDETLLDNSPEDARSAIHNQDFDSKAWKKWTAQGIADTVPGAPAFFKYAAKKGVAVFYISNRDEDESAGTLKNLQHYNLPYADNAHLLLKAGTSSKEDRRKLVLKKYNIVLLCGDNLADFDALYDNHPDEQSRAAATQKLKKQFGNKYIVLPNASYGDWESSLFHFNYKLTPVQRDSIVRSAVKVSEP